MKKAKKQLSAEELEDLVDQGVDITPYLPDKLEPGFAKKMFAKKQAEFEKERKK